MLAQWSKATSRWVSSYRRSVRHGLLGLALGALPSCAAALAGAQPAAEWPLQRWAGDHRAANGAAETGPDIVPPSPTRGWRLCAIYPHLKDSYWLAVNFGMTEEARALGLGLGVREAGGYGQLARQRERVAECLEDEAVDALLIGTVSRGGLNDLLAPQLDHRLVLGVVNDIDPQVVRARIAVPWYQLGWTIGRWLAARHPAGGPPARIAWIPGPADADWVGFIDRGFRTGIAGSAVNVVAERHGDTGRAIQRRLVEAVLDEQPQLDYLVGNAPMAEAAIAELRRRGREGATAIVSSYLTPAVHGGILRGRILAAVTDFPVLQGRLAVRQALRALEGRTIEPYLGPAVELVDKSSLGRFPVQWMLPPAGFVPVYQIAPALP